MHGICRYSHPGTWGHECGKPATLAQQVKGECTADGRYWLARCAECTKWTRPDNAGTRRDAWVPYDPTIHRNAWVRNRWPQAPEVFHVPA